MFVPNNPQGELRRKLQVINETGGIEVKYKKRIGPSMKDMLVRGKPWGSRCNREDCFICQTQGKGDCMNQGMKHKIDCITCKEERGRTVIYYGESARTQYDRGEDHWRAWRTGQKDSVLTIHIGEEHQGEGCQYQMNAVSSLW